MATENSPLGFGEYRLNVDGDNSIVDLDGNPLNSVTGVGGGSDFVHDFEVVFSVPTGGDFYRVDLDFGQRVTFSTRTPWANDPLASFGNDLDTQLIVYSNTGQLIVIGSDSVGDKNAQATFISAADGPYFVQVVAESGAGEYIVEVQIEDVVLLGDFNRNGVVDSADYTVWRDTLGQLTSPYSSADADGNGVVSQNDYEIWRSNFGTSFTTATVDQLIVIGGSGGSGASAAAALSESLAARTVNLSEPAFSEPASVQLEHAAVPTVTPAPVDIYSRFGGMLAGVTAIRKNLSEHSLRNFTRPVEFVQKVSPNALLAVLGDRGSDWSDVEDLQSLAQQKAQRDCQQDIDDLSAEASDLIFAELGLSLKPIRRQRMNDAA